MSSPTETPSTFWHRTLRTPGDAARAVLYEELAALVEAGFGIREALGRLGDRAGRAGMLAESLLPAALEGQPVNLSMRTHPELFEPLETALFTAGEESGRLGESLRALAA